MNQYMALFYTQSAAIKFERDMKNRRIISELIPVPRFLSSSCGIAVKFLYRQDVKYLVTDDVKKIYSIEGKDYELVFNRDSILL